mmetsp:Transcript_58756/g.102818  ORF Transcript_58756/g.102818 Transcript_58756/m.102818 type:complete len:134 (+) Transcript_58756:496-897(+)
MPRKTGQHQLPKAKGNAMTAQINEHVNTQKVLINSFAELPYPRETGAKRNSPLSLRSAASAGPLDQPPVQPLERINGEVSLEQLPVFILVALVATMSEVLGRRTRKVPCSVLHGCGHAVPTPRELAPNPAADA